MTSARGDEVPAARIPHDHGIGAGFRIGLHAIGGSELFDERDLRFSGVVDSLRQKFGKTVGGEIDEGIGDGGRAAIV